MTDLDDVLTAYLLGDASDDERRLVESLLATEEAVRRRHAELSRALLALNAPSPDERGWQRLSLALAGVRRFEHLLPRLAALYDLDEAGARAVLARVDDEGAWSSYVPGIHVQAVRAGPRTQGWVTALVRVQPGASFPEHGHRAHEQVLVLEGGYLDSSGREFWRGEVAEQPAGSRHSFVGLPGIPCLCASLTQLLEN